MKVNETKDVKGPERAPAAAPGERSAAKAPTDRVSLEAANRVAEVVSTARSNSTFSRAARLQQVESALRLGAYKPDIGRLAEQLLAQAEIDARLRAMLRGL